MTPRERVHTALQHKEPDQVPIDSNGIVSSIHETAYAALVRYLGREEQPVILDAVQRIVLASEEVLQELGVDTRYLYPKPPAGWRYQEDAEGYWKDEFGVTYKRVGFYADCVAPPLRAARSTGRLRDKIARSGGAHRGRTSAHVVGARQGGRLRNVNQEE